MGRRDRKDPRDRRVCLELRERRDPVVQRDRQVHRDPLVQRGLRGDRKRQSFKIL